MKTTLLSTLTAVFLLLIPNAIFGQAIALGTSSGFAIFTKAGALTNTGSSTLISGDVGSYSVTPTGFPSGSVTGTIYSFGDPVLANAAADVTTAYGSLSATTTNYVLATPLENQVLVSGVYKTVGAATLNGNMTIDGQNDPSSVFIIKINGAFAVSLNSTITLVNSALAKNVYWQVAGQFDLGAGSAFKGTVVVDGAVNLLDGASVMGRVLTVAGAITVTNTVVTIPLNTTTAVNSPTDQPKFSIVSDLSSPGIHVLLSDLSNTNRYNLKIYSTLGTEVLSVSIHSNQSTTIKTDLFSPGIYFYKLMSQDNALQSGKLFITR